MATGYSLLFSPNLVWLGIALGDYFFFPYDYEAAKSLTNFNWIFKRLRLISFVRSASVIGSNLMIR